MKEPQTRRPEKKAPSVASSSPAAASKRGAVPFWMLFLLAIPALWTAWLIHRNGVDIPYDDEWYGVVPLFQKMDAHTLGIQDFFKLHSEHRLFFPRLAMVGLAQFTNWNIQTELAAVWLLAVVASLNLARIARITGRGLPSGFWALLAANVLFFTPLQYENWLMGMQIVFMLPMVCMTACIWAAASMKAPRSFIVTMILCTVSTFCMASGFVAWVVTFPLLAVVNGKLDFRNGGKWWPIWLGVFAADECLYFNGYVKPTYHPSVFEVFRHPLGATQYFLDYLGSPFGYGSVFDPTIFSMFAGGALFAMFVGSLIYLWRHRADFALVSESLPWISVALIGLVSATLTTVGRLGLGIQQGLSSRYVSFSVMLPIALAFLVPALLAHFQKRAKSPERFAVVGSGLGYAAAMLVLLHALSSVAILDTWPLYLHSRLCDKALVETINIVDEPELRAAYVDRHSDDPALLKERANLLEKLHYLRPGLLKSNSIAEVADPQSLGDSRYGELQQVGNADGGYLGALGWAILPEKGRPADVVLLTYENGSTGPTIFAVCDIGIAKAEAENATGKKAFLKSGFGKRFAPEKLADGLVTIKAWAFDAETSRAYRIAGVKQLTH